MEKTGSKVELIVRPREVIKWGDFKKKENKFGIALDGYVYGPTIFNRKGPWGNFNHHECVNRLATASTCYQVGMYIRQGLLDTFSIDGIPNIKVFVNDCDQDTTLARWLLNNNQYIGKREFDSKIERLIGIENKLDITGGIYTIDPNLPIMQFVTRIFKPYTDAKLSGQLNGMIAKTMQDLIDEIGENITSYVNGKGKKLKATTHYEKLGGGNKWIMIKEKGTNVRNVIFNNGIRAFVSVIENQNGTYNYTIGKMSDLVRFPILELYKLFNKMEGIGENEMDRWGGSDIIGGSPRSRGSHLNTKTIQKEINDYLEIYCKNGSCEK